METDSLVIVLTDQLNGLRQKLIQAENQIIDHKAKGMTAEGQVGKLKRDIQMLTEQNAQLMKEVQDITAKKDKIEQQFSRLDQIQRDFEKAIKKVEEQEDMIKLRNE
jgi:chromosome segregation ATPase